MTEQTDLSAIFGDKAPEAVEAVEAAPVEAPEPTDQPEATAEPVAAPAPEPVKEAKPETPMVPLAALMAERDKARELERRLAQPRPEEPKAPDVFAEPEKYAEFMQRQASQAAMNAKLDISEALARDAFGDERVDQAFQTFQERAANDPALGQSIMASKSPWHALVKWHDAEQVKAEIGTDPAAYRAKVEAEVRAKLEAEMAARTAKVAAPPSVATASNIGGRGAAPAWSGPTPLERILRA